MAPSKRKEAEGPKKGIFRMEFDGASKGNPGKAGAGALLRHPDGTLICELKEGIGIATCNAAEYRALIMGLRAALDRGINDIIVQGDSDLVCKQVNGLWKVESQNLRILWEEAKMLQMRFKEFSIHHIARKLNSAADALANAATELPETEFQTYNAVLDSMEQKKGKDVTLPCKMAKGAMEKQKRGKEFISVLDATEDDAVELPDFKSQVPDIVQDMKKQQQNILRSPLCERETGAEIMQTKEKELYQLEYDGVFCKDHGKAGIGVLLRASNGLVQLVLQEGLGKTTSQAANYYALIAGLRAALKCHISNIEVQGDSSTVITQITRGYKGKNEKMKALWQEADALRSQFKEFVIVKSNEKTNNVARNLAYVAAKLPESMYTETGFHQTSKRWYSTVQNFGERSIPKRFSYMELTIKTGNSSALKQSCLAAFPLKTLQRPISTKSLFSFGTLFSLRNKPSMTTAATCLLPLWRRAF